MKKELFNAFYKIIMTIALIYAYNTKDMYGLIFLGILLISRTIEEKGDK